MTGSLAAVVVLWAAAAVVPAPEESDSLRVADASDGVERLLKRKLCPALRQDARLAADLFTPSLSASSLEQRTVTPAVGGAPELRTFGADRPQERGAFLAALEAQLADVAVRSRCGIGFHRFVLQRRPSRIAELAFEWRMAGVAPDGRLILETGEVVARAEVDAAGAWKLSRLSLGARRRVTADGPRFAEVTAAAGVNERLAERLVPYDLSGDDFNSDDLDRGGLAAADVDGDGDVDLYVMADGRNLYYRNRGDGTFEEVGEQVGLADRGNGRGAVFVDLDGDGDLDLALANKAREQTSGALLLFENTGGGQFRKAGELARGLRELLHVTAGDVDGDGDLDLHVAAYGPRPGRSPDDLLDDAQGAPDLLLINEGRFRFVDRAKAWGVQDRGWTLASTLVDLTGDGRPELVVADDFGRKRLYRNLGDRFEDVSLAAGPGHERANGMGVDVGDWDGDGALDLYFSNMHSNAGQRLAHGVALSPELKARIDRASLGNTLWLGGDGLRFTERAAAEGVADGGWAWGVQLFDADLDGRLDAYSPCGYLTRRNDDDL